MGKNKTPQYNAPAPPKLPTADELYSSGNAFAKNNFSGAYGAREGALGDLAKGNDYYAGFQPTSFEAALGDRYFENAWPGTEESIKHGLSLSGLDSSPLLAEQLGTARSGLEYEIGKYLSDQGNERARYSLTSRLGIDPMQMINPYVETGMYQGNKQASLDYDYAQQLAQIEYQNQVNKYNQKNALYKTIGMVSPIGGAIYGGIDGGSDGLASSFGGSAEMMKILLPALMANQGGGLGSIMGTPSPVNPGAGMTSQSVNPYNFSMNTSPYNPSTYFPGFGGRGGAV